ncbi:purine-nucleoside phosphorylase [Leucobacter chromiiresistens]|uniref:Purine nucleoside phosphorylase n=2 Tax=Leucobacter chromiiresistens TaxID=1079994 RepID=A0A1H0XV02_9MICO|nr:purine-nucleoside phosphorylase [Leucobacter chromiiresistens]
MLALGGAPATRRSKLVRMSSAAPDARASDAAPAAHASDSAAPGAPTSPGALAADAASAIARLTGVERHDIALTLGSGWGKAADVLGETVAVVSADEVPGFHASGVPGHSGTLRSIRLANGKHALIIGARTHYYEGRGVRAVVHGVRTAAAAGAEIMILTNGAGGVDPAFRAGEPVLISDHLNLTAVSPIEGANFVDLTDLYASRLRDVARSVEPSLQQGVYVQLPGPHYETPAEIHYLRTIGGQIVGMSTALEAIAAREAGMEVLGLSLITNPAAGMGDPLSHAEVLAEGRAAEPRLADLLSRVVAQL